MIAFNFDITRVPIEDAEAKQQLLLGITGDFKILIDNRILYREREFPLVEFALQAARWLTLGPRTEEDFEYSSMEAEGVLIWVRRSAGRWRIGAQDQEYEEVHQSSWDVIASAMTDYIRELRYELTVVRGVDVDIVLPGTL